MVTNNKLDLNSALSFFQFSGYSLLRPFSFFITFLVYVSPTLTNSVPHISYSLCRFVSLIPHSLHHPFMIISPSRELYRIVTYFATEF